jgi:hypothetical protein
MSLRPTKRSPLDDAASELLSTHGMKAIWDLHLVAAAANGMGEPELAASLVKLADLAEREWIRRSRSALLIAEL